jgi:hypothetical protein
VVISELSFPPSGVCELFLPLDMSPARRSRETRFQPTNTHFMRAVLTLRLSSITLSGITKYGIIIEQDYEVSNKTQHHTVKRSLLTYGTFRMAARLEIRLRASPHSQESRGRPASRPPTPQSNMMLIYSSGVPITDLTLDGKEPHSLDQTMLTLI